MRRCVRRRSLRRGCFTAGHCVLFHFPFPFSLPLPLLLFPSPPAQALPPAEGQGQHTVLCQSPALQRPHPTCRPSSPAARSGASCLRCLLCLPRRHPFAGHNPPCASLVVVLGFVSLSKKTARCKSLQRAHPALFMLAAGPFALFYPASLIRTRDFFGLKKSAVFPLLPPPSPAPWKFR